LSVDEARFDFSHYKSIDDDEIDEIEKLANNFIKQSVSVEKKVFERNDAEKKFGFRLYQGGVPPGNLIRVLHIPGVDVEACGGMHVDNTCEIDKIKIVKTERIQDGVNRIIFAAGKMVDRFNDQEKSVYEDVLAVLKQRYLILDFDVDISDNLKQASKIFSVPINQLGKTIKRFLGEVKKKEIVEVQNVKEACLNLFDIWKSEQKKRKMISADDVDVFKDKAVLIPGTSIGLIIGVSDLDSIALVSEITSEDNYVVHIYDGSKIVSSASENVDIDLRDIAVEVGKILGGSGGGKPRLTQSGGPRKEKINEALDKARLLTIAKFKNN